MPNPGGRCHLTKVQHVHRGLKNVDWVVKNLNELRVHRAYFVELTIASSAYAMQHHSGLLRLDATTHVCHYGHR